MKKYLGCILTVSVVWLVILGVFLHFQDTPAQNEKAAQEKPAKEQNIEFRDVDSSWMQIPEEGAPETWEVEVDEKMALQIAKAELESNQLDDQYDHYMVCDNPQFDYYIVSRYKPNVLGGGYSVAIRKSDGAMIRAWVEE